MSCLVYQRIKKYKRERNGSRVEFNLFLYNLLLNYHFANALVRFIFIENSINHTDAKVM